MHVAALGNNPIAIAFMIKLGIDIDEQDQNGQTALHYAVKLDCGVSSEFLLANGA